MRGRHWEDREQKRAHHTDVDLKALKAGHRSVGVGDCALFLAGDVPPYIGIIRKFFTGQDGDLKLCVNWLYRPSEVKQGIEAHLEAAPNEIFLSFHKDEISAASLLHPCKLAFLGKGVELPFGISSFVCRRVYDTTKKSLYWLTDHHYVDEHQAEISELLEKTKCEMQTSSSPKNTQQSKIDVLNMVSHAGLGKSRKRERTDHDLDPIKREKPTMEGEVEEGDVRIGADTHKDGCLKLTQSVDQVVQMMLLEQNDGSRWSCDPMSRRTSLVSIIAATEDDSYLSRFVQLGGVSVLDDWLQEVHKGKADDPDSSKETDKGSEELLLVLLRALEKLPVDLDVLKNCLVGKSVNNLRSHRNLEIQRKARKLVDLWKKRVDAEMKYLDEQKLGAICATSWPCKHPISEAHGIKSRSPTDRTNIRGNFSVHTDQLASAMLKEATPKAHMSSSNDVQAVPQEEKSCSSGQSQTWCSQKGTGNLKDEVKSPCMSSPVIKVTSAALRSCGSSGKGLKHGTLLVYHKDIIGEKHRISGGEKVERVITEVVHAENSNSQRLIVRLPNPARSPANSASGGSLSQVGFSSTTGLPSGPLELYDGTDLKSKAFGTRNSSVLASTEPGKGIANYAKVENLKEVNKDFGEATAKEEFRSRPLHAPELGLKEGKQLSSHVVCNADVRPEIQKHSADAKSLESPEVAESGIDLLVSIATCECSEVVETMFGREDSHTLEKNSCRELKGQGICLSGTNIDNEGIQDGRLPNVILECQSEQGTITGRGHLGPHPRDVKSPVQFPKEEPDFCIAEATLEEFSENRAPGQHTFDNSDVDDTAGGASSQGVCKLDEDESTNIENTSIPLEASSAVEEENNISVLLLVGEASGTCRKVILSSAVDLVDHTCKEDSSEVSPEGGNEADVQSDHQSLIYNSSQGGAGTENSKLVNESGQHPEIPSGHSKLLLNDPLGKVQSSIDGVVMPRGVDEICPEKAKVCQTCSYQEEAESKSRGLSPVRVPKASGMEEGMQESIPASLPVANSIVATIQTAVASLSRDDGKDENRESPWRPAFDLNEGLISEESVNNDRSVSKASVLSAPLIAFSTSPGQSEQVNSLAVPVAVVTAARGAFIPPSSPLRSKGELGWKGSAATSAFRRAEPRHRSELNQGANGSGHRGKQTRILDIDLNIADEVACEDTVPVIVGSRPILMRPGLDLNMVDENEGGMGSDSRIADVPSNFLAFKCMNDFDLNDGSDMCLRSEELAPVAGPLSITASAPSSSLAPAPATTPVLVTPPVPPVPSLPYISNVLTFDGSGVAGGTSNSEIAWYSAAANCFSSVAPSSPVGRSESTYPLVMPLNAVSTFSHGNQPSLYHRDLYRSGMTIPSALPYSTSIPTVPCSTLSYKTTNMASDSLAIPYQISLPSAFAYAGYSFGSGFPLTSASYNICSMPYASSTNSSVFPSASPLASVSAVTQAYRRPYVSQVAGSDGIIAWPRPSFDMNVGPEGITDTDAKNESLAFRNVTSQLSFQQTGSLSGQAKEKESEGCFDPFKSGFGSMT